MITVSIYKIVLKSFFSVKLTTIKTDNKLKNNILS